MADIPALLVLGSGDGVVRALHGLDGSLRWEFSVGYGLRGPQLAVAGGSVYVATGHGHVYALRLDDGQLLWQQEVPYGGARRFDDGARVVAGGGIVVVNYARSDVPLNSRCITALDSQNGSERWVFHPPRWLRHFSQNRQVGVALLDADASGVYVTDVVDRPPPRPDWERTVALDARTGRRRWCTRQAAAHGHLSWGSRTSLSTANGTVYTLGKDVCALAAHNGRLRWQRATPSTSHRRVVVAGNDVVCVAGSQVFVTYRAQDGEQLWQVGPHHGSLESMMLMESTVYVGVGYTASGFTIEAHDALTGEVRWVWPHPEQVEHPGRGDLSWRFVGAGGILYVPGPKNVSAVRGSDGVHLWTTPTRDGIPALVAVPATRA